MLKPLLKFSAILGAVLLLLLAGPAFMFASGKLKLDDSWRHASEASTGLAPLPTEADEAIVQVYSARTVGWRGSFAVHTWISVKPEHAETYTTYEITRWAGLRIRHDAPDRTWFGNEPAVLTDLRGPAAARAITRIQGLVETYPYGHTYRAWPGPNSNTFVAWVTRQVPELAVRLPSIALGKDYLGEHVLAVTPSGGGYQLSALGLLGILLSRDEGIELNLLGLVIGIDPDPAIKIPGIGEVGFGTASTPRAQHAVQRTVEDDGRHKTLFQ